ncbi:hypothetical protein FMEAI12_3650010 [Parafrankia sp. Ea1.12]|nr:hypothetical protein FMEAI12_3650010 [Parafrankia sp. Ea1.12]
MGRHARIRLREPACWRERRRRGDTGNTSPGARPAARVLQAKEKIPGPVRPGAGVRAGGSSHPAAGFSRPGRAPAGRACDGRCPCGCAR